MEHQLKQIKTFNEVFNFLTEILRTNDGKNQTSGVGLKKSDTKEGKKGYSK